MPRFANKGCAGVDACANRDPSALGVEVTGSFEDFSGGLHRDGSVLWSSVPWQVEGDYLVSDQPVDPGIGWISFVALSSSLWLAKMMATDKFSLNLIKGYCA